MRGTFSLISDPMAQYRTADAKYQYQQEALKNVVATSQATLGSVDDRMKNIADLAAQVNQTTNQKDAQDLTNSLLVEVLKTLTDMLAIAAQANQAVALLNYTGATDQTLLAYIQCTSPLYGGGCDCWPAV